MFSIDNLTFLGVLLRWVFWLMLLLPLVPGSSRWFWSFEDRKPRTGAGDSLPIWMVDKIPGMTEGTAEVIFLIARTVLFVLLIIVIQMLIGILFVQY